MLFYYAQWSENCFLIFISVAMSNYRIWEPTRAIEKPMHPQRVNVCCRFWAVGIIGPFYFRYEQGDAVIVNGERYHTMLNEFLFPNIQENDMDDIWFQQDRATYYTANATVDILRTVF